MDEPLLSTMTDVSFRHDPSIPASLPVTGEATMGHVGDAIWVATMKADALLGRVSHDYRVQLGATFDWRVTAEDVRVARATLSTQRADALARDLAVARPATASTPDWDASADLLAL